MQDRAGEQAPFRKTTGVTEPRLDRVENKMIEINNFNNKKSMKNKILIVVLAGLISCISFSVSAQKKNDVLDKYRSNGVVPKTENRLDVFINDIKSVDGKYNIAVIYGATMPKGSVIDVTLSKERKTELQAKFHVLDAVSPNEALATEIKSGKYLPNSHSYSNPFEGMADITEISFETDKKFVLVCFEGIDEDRIKTSPLLFVVELNGKRSKVLNKQPYYLKDVTVTSRSE
jgi:hypothetical protein